MALSPNCINNDGHGVIPVAILGSANFDVTNIDASTIRLDSMVDDLVVQIEDNDGVFAPGDATAILTGNTSDGTPFTGTDTICIVGDPPAAPSIDARSKLTTTWGKIKGQ